MNCRSILVRVAKNAWQDDMEQIYISFVKSDLIVFSSPMYWGYLTAQIKTVIDRMEAITAYFKGKTFVVILTYRHHYQSTQAFFERITPFFGVELHTISCCTMDKTTFRDLDIREIPDKLQEAYELGVKLADKA
jgi:multimeric flavodoxin WrbA